MYLGYFTIASKLISSTKRMLIDTFLALIVGIIILGILLGTKTLPANSSALLLVSVLLTNSVYQLVLMFLLGYGLIRFPLNLWNISDNELQLLQYQNTVATDFKNVSESSFNVSTAVADTYKTKEILTTRYVDQALYNAMGICINECPLEFKSSTGGTIAVNKEGKITIHTLAALRTKLNLFKDKFRMAKALLEKSKRRAYNQEDITLAAKRTDGKKTIFWSLQNKESTPEAYTWHILIKPILYKFFAILAGFASILSYLGIIGCMKDVNRNVSVYFLVVHRTNGIGAVLFILITMGYCVYVAFWSLFEIRLAGLMELIPTCTTPESLSFNVRMVARLASPLAFFYLGWIWESGVKYTQGGDWHFSKGGISMPSAFSKFYNIQVLPVLGDAFGTVFPIILIVVSFLVLTNLLNRIFVYCKLDTYQFGQELVTEEQLKEGKRQLNRNKKATARTVQREIHKERIIDIAKADKTGLSARVVGFIWSAETRKTPQVDEVVVAPIHEPASMSGLVERKRSKKSFRLETGWKEEYATINVPGVMCFYKDPHAIRLGVPADFQVDLGLVLSFNEISLGAKGYSLEMDQPDSTVKLRFKTKEELTNWKKLLIEWKDYNMDTAGIYSYMHCLHYSSFYIADYCIFKHVYKFVYVDARKNDSIVPGMNSTLSPLQIASNTSTTTKGKNEYDLESIEIGEFTDKEPEPVKQSKVIGGFFGPKNNKSDDDVDILDSLHIESVPPILEGWIEKKSSSVLHLSNGGDWDRMYASVDENKANLSFFTSDNKFRSTGTNSIDLQLVTDILSYEDKKGTINNTRFNVILADKVFKFKADSVEARDRYK